MGLLRMLEGFIIMWISMRFWLGFSGWGGLLGWGLGWGCVFVLEVIFRVKMHLFVRVCKEIIPKTLAKLKSKSTCQQ